MACNVRRERDAVDALALEIEKMDHIVSAAGWQVTAEAAASPVSP